MSRLLRKRGHQPAKTGVSALMPAGPSSANAIHPTREITMRARSGCEIINQDRRQLLSTAAMYAEYIVREQDGKPLPS